MSSSAKSKSSNRAPLSRERVLRAAIKLSDAEGLESLSMRKLAMSLSVEAMSLYNHVANKEDVLDGMVDIVIAEIEVPEIDKDWQEAMLKRASSAHDVLLKHPWASMLIVSRVNVGPAMLSYINATVGCLVEAGFSYETADHIWNTMDSYIYGFTTQELNFPIDPSEYANAAESFLPMLPEENYPYMNRLARHVIDGTYNGLHDFSFGLDLILRGLEHFQSAENE